MRCQYCDKRLSFAKRLKGDTFCSLEHQELYHDAQAKAAFERLVGSIETPPKSLNREPSGESREIEEADPAEEPQSELVAAANQPSAALEIAALAEAIETTAASERRLARFLPDMPTVADQPAPLLSSYTGEPVYSAVQLPVSSAQETLTRASSVLVVEVSPVTTSPEVAPIAGKTTWPAVPQGYPPVAVSSSATLVIDPSGADLIPLSIGTPFPSNGKVGLSQVHAIETLPRAPRLPSWQPERRANTERSSLLAHPAQSRACEIAWMPRLGSGCALPSLEGLLIQQGGIVRMVPPGTWQSSGSLTNPTMLIAPFFAVAPGTVVPATELPATPAAHLPASLIPRNTLQNEKTTPIAGASELAIAPGQLAAESTIPLRSDPPGTQLSCTWQQTAICNQIPSAPAALATTSVGLDTAAGAVPLARSIAAVPPPNVETTAAVTSATLLLSSSPVTIGPPAMPVSSTAPSAPSEPCQLAEPIGEEQNALSVAHLHPSLPSPWSLVTWSQSLSISTPACQPSDLSKPAEIALSAREGRVDALAPSSPSRRGLRLTPLKPQPNEAPSMPVAPRGASLAPPPALEPMRPGSEGTATPILSPVRMNPASMPARPHVLHVFGMERDTGPAASGLSSEDFLRLRYIDMNSGISKSASGLCLEPTTALPSAACEGPGFSIVMALASDRIQWGMIPPDQLGSTVQPLPALRRSAWSTSAGLPRTVALQPANAKVQLDVVLGKSLQL